MLYHYYYKRLYLFKIPYKTLLAYHTPMGNTIKFWTSFHMNSFILAVRNDIYILNIAYTMIQIRKALNTIFHKVRYRGTLTIYAQASKALKINQESVFNFITSWIPGLLTNYQLVTTAIQAYKIHLAISLSFLKRPQKKAIEHTYLNPLPLASTIRNSFKVPHIPRVPSISLSILDCPIWLNECACLGIPSIQLCDTQSSFGKITYPITANQRSVVFSNFIVHLAAEVCNTSLISSHLEFLSFHKYHGQKSFSAGLDTKHIFPFDFLHPVNYQHMKRWSQRLFNVGERARHRIATRLTDVVLYHTKRKFFRNKMITRHYITQRVVTRRKPVIINKYTYIFNKRFFTYQVKDYIHNNITTNYTPLKHYYTLIHHKIWKFIAFIKQLFYRLSKLFPMVRRRKFYRYFGKLNYSLRKFYQHIIVSLLGLKRALSRKRREKRRYLTMISLKKRDINSLILCSLLITPHALTLLQKSNTSLLTIKNNRKPKSKR
jgi:ribosomal protein S2